MLIRTLLLTVSKKSGFVVELVTKLNVVWANITANIQNVFIP